MHTRKRKQLHPFHTSYCQLSTLPSQAQPRCTCGQVLPAIPAALMSYSHFRADVAPPLFNYPKAPISSHIDSQVSHRNIIAELFGYYDASPKVGEEKEGGVVFYVDALQRKALISAIEDIGLFAWSIPPAPSLFSQNMSPPLFTETGLFTGKTNTDKLCAQPGYPAAQAARAYQAGGYSDWSLPSHEELRKMYEQKDTINTVGKQKRGKPFMGEKSRAHNYAEGYWSSSETSRDYAGFLDFYLGETEGTFKSDAFSVRPLRIFSY